MFSSHHCCLSQQQQSSTPPLPSIAKALMMLSSRKKWLKATAFACLNETTVFAQEVGGRWCDCAVDELREGRLFGA